MILSAGYAFSTAALLTKDLAKLKPFLDEVEVCYGCYGLALFTAYNVLVVILILIIVVEVLLLLRIR